MRRPDSAPARLLGMRPGEDPAGMARLVRSSVNAPRDAVPRLKGRIRSTLRRRSVWRRRYVRAGVVGVIIFLAGGVVGAMVQPIVRFHKQHRVDSVENIYGATSPPRRHRASIAPTLAPQSQVSLDEEIELSAELPAELDVPIPEPSDGTYAAERASDSAVPLGRSRATLSPKVLATAPTPALAPPLAPSIATPSTPRLSIPAGSSRPAALASRNSDSPSRSARANAPVPQGEATREPSTPQVPPAHRPADGIYPRIAMLEPPRQPEPQAGVLQAESSSPPRPAVTLPAPHAPPSAPAQNAPAVAPPAPVAPPPRPLATPASSEQVLLGRALHSLRSQRRPDDALAILDAYAARFPHGSLGPEAARLRTEALLALGQKPAALAELSRDLGSNTVGGEENRLVRGELHADAGRWKDALLDFDAVARTRLAQDRLAPTPASAKLRDHLERALWGRASARSHLGDPVGATADLRDYLQRFPRGRFAAQAGHLLDERR